MITLVVMVNHGSFTISGDIANTNASGIAAFPEPENDRMGGRTMTAVSQFDGSVSAEFQIRNQ